MIDQESKAVEDWLGARPSASGGELDLDQALGWCRRGQRLLEQIPPKPSRSQAEQETATLVLGELEEARSRVIRGHLKAIYSALSQGGACRIEDLVERAAQRFPGLVSSTDALKLDRDRLQKDKDGLELDHAVLLANLLGDQAIGTEILMRMRYPQPSSYDALRTFERTGALDLGAARVIRRGCAAHIEITNPEFLNAEDDRLLDALESAVDVALLDPAIQIGVLRGCRVEHRKYAGRRVFCSGINLTFLYEGKISYLYYVRRELGLVSKLYRGLTDTLSEAEELARAATDKPWLMAVEAHAIGGGCQLMLVGDYILAERGAYCSVPARNEGFIPGLANLRLPHFVGQRLARQMVNLNHVVAADSDEGRLLFDEVVPADQMDAAIDRAVGSLVQSGLAGLSGNRRAMRMGQEPLQVFRSYMAAYAIEQGRCLFSKELIQNLERHWLKHRHPASG